MTFLVLYILVACIWGGIINTLADREDRNRSLIESFLIALICATFWPITISYVFVKAYKTANKVEDHSQK